MHHKMFFIHLSLQEGMSERSRTREMLIECLVVRRMREDSTVPHLSDQHRDSRSGLLLAVTVSVLSPFKFFSVNNPSWNHSCVRHVALSASLQQGAGAQHLSSPVIMCRLGKKCARFCAISDPIYIYPVSSDNNK